MATKTQQEIIEALARNNDTTVEQIEAAYHKATPEQLRGVENAADAWNLLDTVAHDIVDQDQLDEIRFFASIGATPHSVSFSALADEVEAAQAVKQ